MRCKCGKPVSDILPLDDNDPMCDDCHYDFVASVSQFGNDDDMEQQDLDDDN